MVLCTHLKGEPAEAVVERRLGVCEPIGEEHVEAVGGAVVAPDESWVATP